MAAEKNSLPEKISTLTYLTSPWIIWIPIVGLILFALYTHLKNKKLIRHYEKETERQKKRLEEVMELDMLTDLLNRQAIQKIVPEYIRKSRKEKSPLSMLILDIDEFKAFNDRHGQKTGDELLKTISGTLKKILREDDKIARWTGKSFIVITPKTKAKSALFLSEKFRRVLKNAQEKFQDTLTMSIGLAQIEGGEDFNAWYMRVNQALDKAKTQGGNQSVCNWNGRTKKTSGPSSTQRNLLKLVWKEKYNSGHHKIDSQHMALCDMANKLVDAVLREDDQMGVNALLDEFIQATQRHFDYEIDVITRAKCPTIGRHLREHKKLINRLSRLANRYQTGGLASFILLQFITQELVSAHMAQMDQEYFKWFKS